MILSPNDDAMKAYLRDLADRLVPPKQRQARERQKAWFRELAATNPGFASFLEATGQRL